MEPKSEAELAEIIRDASEALSIRGGGTRGFDVDGAMLSTQALSGISLYEPGGLILVAGAGTPIEQIETALAQEGQRLAFEPMDHRIVLARGGTPTIGGVVAANVSGPRRIQAGAARDFALGVRFVDGRGEITSNGGRVMKNVTGYDLVKLICGSFGTLGVISEVSLKVLPVPETEMTLLVQVARLEDAVATLSRALGSPFDVTGAAYDPEARLAYVRLEGFEDSVQYRAQGLKMLLAPFGELSCADAPASAILWRDIRDVRAFADHAAIWKVSMKPGDVPDYLDCLDQMHSYSYRLDWGGGLIWIAAQEGDLRDAASYGQEGRRDLVDEGVRVLHANLQHNSSLMGGHATLVKYPDPTVSDLRRFQPEAPGVAAISAAIRAKFDPRGILNPGVMG